MKERQTKGGKERDIGAALRETFECNPSIVAFDAAASVGHDAAQLVGGQGWADNENDNGRDFREFLALAQLCALIALLINNEGYAWARGKGGGGVPQNRSRGGLKSIIQLSA